MCQSALKMRPDTIDSPATLAEWWDYVKTDCDAFRVRYFLRNQSAIRSSVTVSEPITEYDWRTQRYVPTGETGTRWTTVDEFLAFLATKTTLTNTRGNIVIRELAGEPRFEFLVSANYGERTPLVVCHAVAESPATGAFVSIADK